jgi:hypothetical protein
MNNVTKSTIRERALAGGEIVFDVRYRGATG